MKNDLHPLTKADHALLIKAARVALGNALGLSAPLSQSNLATLLGVGTAAVQEWEQGRRSPSGTVYLLLERIFDERGIPKISNINRFNGR